MITWTPEAERVVYAYLNDISRLAIARGEDGEELQASLMEHIRSEVAVKGWDLVTEEQAQHLISQLGTPEAVVGEQPAAPTPTRQVPPPLPPRSKSRTGCIVGVIAIVLLIIAIPILIILVKIGSYVAVKAPTPSETTAIDATEELVYSRLAIIARAEERYKDACVVDKNGDGIGDYGTLEELNAWFADETGEEIPFHAHPYEFNLWVVYGDDATPPGYRCTTTSLNQSIKTEYYIDETRVLRYTTDGMTVPDENARPLRMLQIEPE